MPLAYTNGIKINYALTGEGADTIVLINGLADDLETWSTQIPALVTAGYRVLTFDNRGIGKSEKPEGPYNAELLANDTKGLVAALEITQFHLLGVSMGGMIAQIYGLKYPADLKTLTLVCTYAAPGPFCSRMFDMWAVAARTIGPAFVAKEVLLWCFTLDFFRDREDELREMENAIDEADQPWEANSQQLPLIQNFDSRKEVHRLGQVRTLVMAGEEDILIPTRLSQELHEMIPNSQWQTVKGGHACMWEFPHQFNAAYLRYLEQFDTTYIA
ncbi:hypothetical protein MMC19_006945 [Ptychographa xylographoides]|nr:hypothetical protein [Ptychographa xylographoides]